jgi:hypothetical protein
MHSAGPAVGEAIVVTFGATVAFAVNAICPSSPHCCAETPSACTKTCRMNALSPPSARPFAMSPAILRVLARSFLHDFGKADLREWANARAYTASDQRKDRLPEWTIMYHWHRPNGSLNPKSRINRLDLTMDNLLRFDS